MELKEGQKVKIIKIIGSKSKSKYINKITEIAVVGAGDYPYRLKNVPDFWWSPREVEVVQE